jgi:hypothetical protein
MKIKTKKVIEVSDWDKLVSETYGRIYSLQQQDGCKERGICYLTVPDAHAFEFKNDAVSENNDDDEMGVSFKAWLERDPKKPLENQEYDFELEMWWERRFYPSVEIVANDLYEKKLLDAGEYGINIAW